MLNFSFEYWGWPEWIFAGLFVLVGLIVICIVLYGIFWIFTPYKAPFKIKAKVKHLSFSPSKSFVGVGPSSNGGAVTTVGFTSESYNIIFKLEDGDTWTIDNEELFNDVEVGDNLVLTVRIKTIWGSDNWDLVGYSKK